MADVFYIDSGHKTPVAEKVYSVLEALGGLERIVHPRNIVFIKPNFVAPFCHATTSLEILEALIRKVKECGAEPVIGESAGFEFDTDKTFEVLGLYKFGRRNNVRIVNLDKERFESVRLQSGIVREVEISALALRADVLINVPKLKRHSVTKVTISAKNLFGLVSRESRRRLHAFGLERGIFELSRVVRSSLVLVDASVVGSRAVYGEYEKLGAIIGGTDPYAVDMFCCRILKENYNKIGYLRIARNRGFISEEAKYATPVQGFDEAHFFPDPVGKREPFTNMIYRVLYQAVYLLDILYNKIIKRWSFIPALHFYLGIRPYLDKANCTGCGKCLEICPVAAIEIAKKSINAYLCMPLRCMRCVPACPVNAISIRGRNVPKNFGKNL